MSYYSDYCFAIRNEVIIPLKFQKYLETNRQPIKNEKYTYYFLDCHKDIVNDELVEYFRLLVKKDGAAIIRIGEQWQDVECVGDVSEFEFECTKNLTDCESEYSNIYLMIAIKDNKKVSMSSKLRTFLYTSSHRRQVSNDYSIFHFETIALTPYFEIRGELMSIATNGNCAAIRLYDDKEISEFFGILDEFNIGFQREINILENKQCKEYINHIANLLAPKIVPVLPIEDLSGSMNCVNFNKSTELELLYKRKEILEKILRKRLLLLL